jgi:anti-anti-sigma regulatory factor
MIGQLAALHKQVTAAGGRLVLCRLQAQATEVIETCRLTNLFHVYPDEQAAVKSFG